VAALEEEHAGSHERSARLESLQSEREALVEERERSAGEARALREELVEHAEGLASLQSEHDALRAAHDHLADEAITLRDQVQRHEGSAERLAEVEGELRSLQTQHEAGVQESERLRLELDARELALNEAAARHESALLDLGRLHQEEISRREEERAATLRASEELGTGENAERTRLESDLDAARSELARERAGLEQELDRLRGEAERWRGALESSAHRIEALVRAREEQDRQRREMESRVQRLEESRRDEIADWKQKHEDAHREREALSQRHAALDAQHQSLRSEYERLQAGAREKSERSHGIPLHYPAVSERASGIDDFLSQLGLSDENSGHTEDLRADLASAREKIQQLTELLESSEEERMGLQSTLMSLGIRLH
jgi:chromosome segregation ATPase